MPSLPSPETLTVLQPPASPSLHQALTVAAGPIGALTEVHHCRALRAPALTEARSGCPTDALTGCLLQALAAGAS